MQGRLVDNGLVALACRLGYRRASGGIAIDASAGARHRVYLRAGDVVGLELAAGDLRFGAVLCREAGVDVRRLEALCAAPEAQVSLLGGRVVAHGLATSAAVEHTLRRQTELRLDRLAGLGPATLGFDAAAGAPGPRARVRPLSLLAWAQARVRAELEDGGAERVARRLADRRLAVRSTAADPAMWLPVERRLLRELRTPRPLAELRSVAGAPERVALELVHFLDRAGELEVAGGEPAGDAPASAATEPAPQGGQGWAPELGAHTAARRELGVGADATPSAIRAAFRRLVRELHPDRHHAASSATLRELGERLGRVTSAYRELLEVGALAR
ncbi:MAG: J domain-containing protein [Polyangiaceae bacterium]|nr:J domain-containing protein [Polyangiaceae bacterium]